MKKNQGLIILGLLLFSFFTALPMIVSATSSIIGTSTDEYATGFTTQRKSFYANGLFWVFYCDGTNMVYQTSTNGSSWSSITTVRECDVGYDFSIWFVDGANIHYACRKDSYLYYRAGSPEYDGTITWIASERLIQTYNPARFVSISVDSDGYAWIGYQESGVYHENYAIKSGNNNGTWGTTEFHSLGFSNRLVSLVPLSSGEMYAILASDSYVIWGSLWNGTTMVAEQVSTSIPYFNHDVSVVTDSNYNIYIVFTDYGPNLNTIICIKRTYSTGTWGSEITVKDGTITGPTLSIVDSTLYCFWAAGTDDIPVGAIANTIYYQTSVDGVTWSDMTVIINESADGLTTPRYLMAFYKSYYGKVGLSYMTKTVSPYNVCFINLLNNVACDSTPVFYQNVTYGWVNVTVANWGGILNLKTVDIQLILNGGTQNFTLRWLESADIFYILYDNDGICIHGSSFRESMDDTTNKFNFQFQIHDGNIGAWDVNVTSVDDYEFIDSDTYSNEFTLSLHPPIINDGYITDMDNGDNLYAMKGHYTFIVKVSDPAGATDISGVSVRGMQGLAIRWMVNATGLDGVPSYSITQGSSVIDLNQAACSWVTSGTNGTLTLKIRFEWDYPQEEDCELAVWVIDSLGDSAGWFTVRTNYYDVITRLTTINFSATATTTSLNAPFIISGEVRYATTPTGNMSSTSYPPNNQFTAVKIYNGDGIYQNQDTTIVNGFFSLNATSPANITTTLYYAWLDMAPDYVDGYAPDRDVVSVSTQATFPFVDFLSNAFAFFGLVGAVTTTIYGMLTAFSAWFTTATVLMVSLITSIVAVIFFVGGTVILWFTRITTNMINLLTIIGNLFNGTLVPGSLDIWAVFNVSAWIDAVPIFVIIWWIDSIPRRSRRTGRSQIELIIGDIQVVSYLVGEVWSWTNAVFYFVWGVINSIASRF